LRRVRQQKGHARFAVIEAASHNRATKPAKVFAASIRWQLSAACQNIEKPAWL